MDELIELERVDLARVQLGEAEANVLEQPAQLVLVVVAEPLCCGLTWKVGGSRMEE